MTTRFLPLKFPELSQNIQNFLFHPLAWQGTCWYIAHMKRLSTYTKIGNKASTRLAALGCNLLGVLIFGAVGFVLIWLSAACVVHQGIDVTLVTYGALSVTLTWLYFLITRLPEIELEILEFRFGNVSRLFEYIPDLAVSPVSNLIAPPFIPPRHLSSAY